MESIYCRCFAPTLAPRLKEEAPNVSIHLLSFSVSLVISWLLANELPSGISDSRQELLAVAPRRRFDKESGLCQILLQVRNTHA